MLILQNICDCNYQVFIKKENNMDNLRIEKFKNIFRSLDRSWLLRHYVYVIAFLIVLYMTKYYDPGMFAFFVVSGIFYPFAMFIYESIFNFLIGENAFMLPLQFTLILKFLRFWLVLGFAIPIGTIGLAYLYYRVNKD